MAYNQRYNPDALPAYVLTFSICGIVSSQTKRNNHRHVEPEQAAQIMNHGQSTGPPARSNSYNKPIPPPPPSNMRPSDDRYGRPNSQAPPSGPAPSSQQGYNDYGRQSSGRYDPNGPQSPRYGQSNYNQPPPPARNNFASPPPQSYGQGPPPQGYHNRPPIPDNQRPPTTAPQPPRDGNDREALWPLFLQVDKHRTGQLSEAELRRALVNGDYTAFDEHTVKMMIRMFDTDRSGTINFDEFCGLWGFLAAWRGLFDRFDVDRSGNISLREFEDALVAFGYRLSPQFVALLFGTYARSQRGRGDEYERQKVLSFDLFVQACISLKRMTDVFKKYDSDRDGYITLSL